MHEDLHLDVCRAHGLGDLCHGQLTGEHHALAAQLLCELCALACAARSSGCPLMSALLRGGVCIAFA